MQNPADKREIMCDDKLRAVMGGEDRVTMVSSSGFRLAFSCRVLIKSTVLDEQIHHTTPAREVEQVGIRPI